MTTFFNKFKIPYFWLIFGPFSQFFPILGAKIFFSRKSGSVTHLWHHAKIQKKLIPRKHLDRRKDHGVRQKLEISELQSLEYYSEGPSWVCSEGPQQVRVIALGNFGYLARTCFFITNSIFRVNAGVAQQIYVFKVKSCLVVAQQFPL